MKVCPICGKTPENKIVSSLGRSFDSGCDMCNNYIMCLTNPDISGEAKTIAIKWAAKAIDSGKLCEEDAETFKLWKENALRQLEGTKNGSVKISEKQDGENAISSEYTNKAEKLFSFFAILTFLIFTVVGLMAGVIGIVIGAVVGGVLGAVVYNIGMLFIEMSNNIAKNNRKITELEETIKKIEAAVITGSEEQ